MPTTREVEAAKAERLAREARFYTPDRLGLGCPVCREKVPLALTNAGVRTHPTCDHEWRSLSAAAASAARRTVTP